MEEIKIEVNLSSNGVIYVETKGIKGEKCIEELENLMMDIIELESIKKTDEYYQKNINPIVVANSIKRR